MSEKVSLVYFLSSYCCCDSWIRHSNHSTHPLMLHSLATITDYTWRFEMDDVHLWGTYYQDLAWSGRSSGIGIMLSLPIKCLLCIAKIPESGAYERTVGSMIFILLKWHVNYETETMEWCTHTGTNNNVNTQKEQLLDSNGGVIIWMGN